MAWSREPDDGAHVRRGGPQDEGARPRSVESARCEASSVPAAPDASAISEVAVIM
jgi:hypothetical protein